MKRYEKMSKEEIIDYLCMFEDSCYSCPHVNDETKCKDDCGQLWKEWLNEEIEMVPRAWTFRTVEEAVSARNTLRSNNCEKINCHGCKYLSAFSNGYSCSFHWLYELVEKPAEEKA